MSKKAHPGFAAVAKSIASKEGVPMESARAILASAAHHASPSAIKANPHLARVHGAGKQHGK